MQEFGQKKLKKFFPMTFTQETALNTVLIDDARHLYCPNIKKYLTFAIGKSKKVELSSYP